MKIKICGIQDPEMAFFTAQAGADFVGILQCRSSKRYVPASLAKEIAAAAKEGGATPVAVFVDAERAEIEALGIETVQLYGKIPVLPETFRCIYANHPEKVLREGLDYLLFDHELPGRGLSLDLDTLKVPQGSAFFLAGGLNADNVGVAIEKLRPHGIDVSSGVEINGMQDREKIKTFIQKVREYE
jgi:phosphoribosylanthranilate isomerase